MRLLKRGSNGELSLTEHTEQNVPVYAILSHTWGEEEVTFQDVESDMGKSKAGWKKIEFCANQAATDGLKYFWIDTCCIDKKNAVELSAAINSMFRWYQKAVRCYVYLTDVSMPEEGESNFGWEPAFRKSRWFTRGWTLQELIAPSLVEFFSSEGKKFGSRASLESMIHEITGIARSALRGGALCDFSIEERMSWVEYRSTTIEEDKAYCLLGVFDVSMPLIYGEGKEKASGRLQRKIHKSSKGSSIEQFVVGLDLLAIPESAQFVARKPELADMQRVLQSGTTRTAVVLHGLGGIGKTQLAIAYAMQHKEKYTAIFWLNANDNDSLLLSFRDVARQVLKYHPTGSFAGLDLIEDLQQVANMVKAWLEQPKNRGWLMIFDNYDNPRIPSNTDRSAVDLRQFLPRADHGSIIITTRSSQVRHGQRIHIQKLPIIQEGLEILSNMSGREGIENDSDAIELAKELDGLPLALSTAGAYLEQVTTSFGEYRQLYNASWLRLQQTSPQLSSYEDRSLCTTWQITFNQIQKQDEGSANLLKLWAYFDRQDLWFELLQCDKNPEWMQKLTKDKMGFDKAMRLLRDYGLVDVELSTRQQSGSAGYSVHSCVHSWMVYVLNEECDGKLAKIALTCVASAIPHTSTDKWWISQRRLLQHASRLEQLIQDDKVNIEELNWTLFKIGLLYYDQGKLAEAEAIYSRTLQECEKALGPKNEFTLNTISNLGSVYSGQCKWEKAEAMQIRALQGYEETLGPKHPLSLNSVNNLGNLYYSQGKFVEAEAAYIRALQGYEETHGARHIPALKTINNLGMLYHGQGNLVQAEVMFNRALRGYEEVLGPEHTSTLDTVNNIGILYKDQGKLAEAEAMCSRALLGTEEALGPKHFSTLTIVNCLGVLYCLQDRLEEAEVMYTRGLRGYEETIGPNHMLTLSTVSNLGVLYFNQDKLVEAEAMYNRALQGYEERLMLKHSTALNTVNNLGMLYRSQGDMVRAEAMFTRALQEKEETLGPKHTSTLDTVNNLGTLYQDQGKLADAEAMYIRALQGYEDALGHNLMSSYIPALNVNLNLGDIYTKTKQLDKAKTMYTTALAGFRKAQGPSSISCSRIESQLQALQLEQTEIETPKNSSFGDEA